MRFVLDPEGCVTADLAAKLPGRGAWVLATREAVEKAAAKGLFARAFKAPAKLAGGSLADTVEAGLEARALAALGLARRAGKAVAGFDQVRGALKERRASVLLTAAEAGEDGAGKLAGLAGSLPVIRAFSAAAQSAALGKDGVVHAAVLAGPEAERLLREARRLDGFRRVFAGRPLAEAGD